MKRILSAGMAAIAALILSACTVGSQYIRVSGFSITESSIELAPGASMSLTSEVTPANAENRAVSWTSSDVTIATVAAGFVTGLKNGTATITGTTADGGFSDTVIVSVRGLELTAYNAYLVGAASTCVVTASQGTAAYAWASSDTDIVTVSGSGTNNATGTLTAVASGKATITVTNGESNPATLTVCVSTASSANLKAWYEFESAGVNGDGDTIVKNLAGSSYDMTIPLYSATVDAARDYQVPGASGANGMWFPGSGILGGGVVTASGGLAASAGDGVTISAYVKATSDWSNFLKCVPSSGQTIWLDLPNMFEGSATADVSWCYPGHASYNTGCAAGYDYSDLATISGQSVGAFVGPDGYAFITIVITSSSVKYYGNGNLFVSYDLANVASLFSTPLLDAFVNGTVKCVETAGNADVGISVDNLRIYGTALDAASVLAVYGECEALR